MYLHFPVRPDAVPFPCRVLFFDTPLIVNAHGLGLLTCHVTHLPFGTCILPRASPNGGVGRFLSKLHQPGRIPSSALPIPQTPFPRFRRCYTRVFLLSCFLFWCHFTFALHRRGRMRLSRPFYSTPLMHRHSRPWYSDRQPPTNTRIKAPTAPKNTSPPAPRTYITDLAISKP